MTLRIALFIGFAALTGVLSAGCTSKCSSLSSTCDKCVDQQEKESCKAVVNTGNNDSCDVENQQLSGVCR
jgi:hypothetical protein